MNLHNSRPCMSETMVWLHMMSNKGALEGRLQDSR